jgi:hypothetical protein
MQETLLAELSTTRRVRLHGAVAEGRERQYGDRSEQRAAMLASHYAESSTLNREHAERAFRYSRLAADQATAQFASGEANRHLDYCAQLVTDRAVTSCAQ